METYRMSKRVQVSFTHCDISRLMRAAWNLLGKDPEKWARHMKSLSIEMPEKHVRKKAEITVEPSVQKITWAQALAQAARETVPEEQVEIAVARSMRYFNVSYASMALELGTNPEKIADLKARSTSICKWSLIIARRAREIYAEHNNRSRASKARAAAIRPTRN